MWTFPRIFLHNIKIYILRNMRNGIWNGNDRIALLQSCSTQCSLGRSFANSLSLKNVDSTFCRQAMSAEWNISPNETLPSEEWSRVLNKMIWVINASRCCQLQNLVIPAEPVESRYQSGKFANCPTSHFSLFNFTE